MNIYIYIVQQVLFACRIISVTALAGWAAEGGGTGAGVRRGQRSERHRNTHRNGRAQSTRERLQAQPCIVHRTSTIGLSMDMRIVYRRESLPP